MAYVDEFAAEYESQGYQRVTSQVTDVSQPIDNPRVYTVQVLTIRSEVNADMAVLCQVMEIRGTVNGDIDFSGQVLVIKDGAVVNGNIKVKSAQTIQVESGGKVSGDIDVTSAQAIQIRGTVEGKVKGTYQVLDWPEQPPAEATAPDETESDDSENSADETIPDAEPEASLRESSARPTERAAMPFVLAVGS